MGGYALTPARLWRPKLLKFAWLFIPFIASISIFIQYIVRMTNTKVQFGYIGFVDEKDVASLISFIILNILLVFSSSFFNYALDFDAHYNKTRILFRKF